MSTNDKTALSASDVAEKLGTDAKTLRQFLRADGTYKPVTAPGGRGRYAFSAGDVAKIRPLFKKWVAERAASRKAKADADAAVPVEDAS